MGEDEAYARIRAQASAERRRAAADVLLPNEGTLAELADAVDALWRGRLVPFEANLRTGRPAPEADSPVLAEPDPEWTWQARRLIARLHAAVGDRMIRADHVGSTAVPGLLARDVLDLQVVVADDDAGAAVVRGARAAGFVPAVPPAADGFAGRIPRHAAPPGAHAAQAGECPAPPGEDAAPAGARVALTADPGRPARIRVRTAADPSWRHAVLLRDWLRAEPAERATYAAVKRDLAARPGTRTDAYDGGKRRWRGAALAHAEAWAEASDWRP
jgi:dephospho-CoA kinase